MDSVASSLPEKVAARPKVLVNGSGISPSVEGHLSASGVKVTECEMSEDARPPVRYPSPSVIARLRTERPHPPGAEQETQAVIFVAEHDSSQHSLTEVDLSLTPLRGTHSRAQSTSGDEGPDSQQEPSRGASADISIGPLVSEVCSYSHSCRISACLNDHATKLKRSLDKARCSHEACEFYLYIICPMCVICHLWNMR